MTRRDFLTSSTVAVAAGVIGRSGLARAWEQQPQPITPVFTPIRRNVGWFTGRGGTIGFLVDAKGVAVVDSQYPDSAKLFLDGLNERSKNRPVDRLINTHHHFDHTDGNIVFKGVAKKIVAQTRAAEMMHNPPGRTMTPQERLFPDATFTETWREQVGDEWVAAKFHGPAHTGGDCAVTFERANVVHMGDLLWNRRHPVIDRPAGAQIRNWATIVEKISKEHDKDTVYIAGHANTGLPVACAQADLLLMRDYFTALLDFTQKQMKDGKSREQILATATPLAGFDAFGNLNATVLGNAYDELAQK